jgi:hypothetical protein
MPQHLIQPGTYRESISLANKASSSGGGITFAPAAPGAVIISRADVWVGWQQDPSTAGQYVHSWHYHWRPCNLLPSWPSLTDIVRRREMSSVNGSALVQTLSSDNLTEGSFFGSEQEFAETQ